MEIQRRGLVVRRVGAAAAALACGIAVALLPGAAAHAAPPSPTEAQQLAAHGLAGSPEPAATTGWDLEAAQEAVLSGPISALPGSPARLDEDAVAAALDGTNIRVLTMPFAPVNRDEASELGQQRIELRQWASQDHDIDLVTVVGYEVNFNIFTLSPDSMTEIEEILAYGDVTAQVLYGIEYLILDERPADAPPPSETRRVDADAQLIEEVAAALETDGVYVAPDAATGATEEPWTVDEGLLVRAAFFPTAERGAPLPDLLGPLRERFPDDVVAVVHGRYLEAAGPSEIADLVHGSALWTYGTYSGSLLGWDIGMPRIVSLFTDRMALLRTGVVSDQEPPSPPADVVSNAKAALPWVFGAAAVLIAAAVVARPLLFRRRDVDQHAAAAGATQTRLRRSLSVELAEFSRQLLGVEPLALEGPAREQVDIAAERYRVARETLSKDGDIRVVQDALASASGALRLAAKTLGVSLAEAEPTDGDAVVAERARPGSATSLDKDTQPKRSHRPQRGVSPKRSTRREPSANRRSGRLHTSAPVGALRASPRHDHEWRRLLRDVVVRELAVAVCAGLAIVLAVVVWPRISLAFSPVKPIVHALDSSAVYAGPGADAADADQIASIVGTRPLVTIILTGDDITEMKLPERPLDICSAVVDYQRDVIAQVILDGDFAAGCEGDDLPLRTDWFRWDVRFWLQHSNATRLVHGNNADFAQQLAIAYDAEVRGDRVEQAEREFSASAGEISIAVGLVAGVLAGAAVLFLLLRWLTLRGFAAADRRRGWEYERDEIDHQLGDIALTMIGADPQVGPSPPVVTAAADIAPEYSAALADLAGAQPGQELAELAERVAGLHERISEAERAGSGAAS